MTGIIDRFTQKEHCDIFRFGRRIEQKDTKLYEEFRKDLEKSLSEIGVNVTVSVKIGRIGEMTMNTGKN